MNFKFSFLLVALTLTLTQCKKEDKDLTSDIVGKYTNEPYYLKITVNKVDESTVWLSLEGYLNLTFSETKMTSKTTFTLNKISQAGYYGGQVEYTGTGTNTGTNISVLIHRKSISLDGSVEEDDFPLTASK